MESQICSEFHRISNVNLKNRFYAELDQHIPRLLTLFRKKAARTGKVAGVLDQLFNSYDLQEQVDANIRRAAVLRALPTYLHEDDSGFLKTWNMPQPDDPETDNLPVGLILISAGSTDAVVFCPNKVAVVLEGNIVVDFPTLAEGARTHWAETLGQTQDTLGKPHLLDGLGTSWDPREELDEVAKEKKVWASLLRLLPPRPHTG
ncbi:uncharacterized protein LOC141789322 [Halichoeres trimaculatus]|uniref:uncharacterized protein LOC141789322 n=1 Tax=Halichoeres trimaculatus TaxID=147232 RepID=UPI003D9E690B